MIKQVALYKPPFIPASEQVIYLDFQNNKSINAFITKHYEWLKKLFLSRGLQFCYLPLLGKDVLKYNAPYLTDAECDEILCKLPSLQECIINEDDIRGPVLAFTDGREDSFGSGIFVLHCIEIDNEWYKPTKSIFKLLAEEIISSRKKTKPYAVANEDSENELRFRETEEDIAGEEEIEHCNRENRSCDIRFSLRDGKDEEDSQSEDTEKKQQESISPTEKISISGKVEADECFEEQAIVLVEEIKERINALREYGVNTMFLHSIIDEGEKISSLYITKDYRILLSDYDNMEIIIPDLPKAVFFLFLRHPEGIRFKDLADYREELINIYRALNPIGGTQRQQQSIQELTNPLSNSINEKCAKIREAFVSKFDDRLAKNYYITGKRGTPKRISLEPSLVVWE